MQTPGKEHIWVPSVWERLFMWLLVPRPSKAPPCYLAKANKELFFRHKKKFILSPVLICNGNYYFVICLAFYWQPKLAEIISLAYNAQFRFILLSLYHLLWYRQQPTDLVSCKLEQVLSQKGRASPNTSSVLSLEDFESVAHCKEWIIFSNYTISFSQLPSE